MYKKILVPLDGSQLSERALPYVRIFAQELKVSVELLQVIEPDGVAELSGPEHGRYFDEVGSSMEQTSISYLKQIVGSFPDSLAVSWTVEKGNPPEVIADRAAAYDGTLIAMSTHGRSGLQRWLLGSVARKVVRASVSPVLLVRADDNSVPTKDPTLGKVLVPLDGSSLAEQVFPHIAELATKMALEVVLLRVYQPSVPGHTPYTSQITKIVRDAAKNYLEQTLRQLQVRGIEKASYLLLRGNPAEEIIGVARGTPDNLVVICTHGRSGVGRWVLGSVTENVVHHSGGPVLIIRAQPRQF